MTERLHSAIHLNFHEVIGAFYLFFRLVTNVHWFCRRWITCGSQVWDTQLGRSITQWNLGALRQYTSKWIRYKCLSASSRYLDIDPYYGADQGYELLPQVNLNKLVNYTYRSPSASAQNFEQETKKTVDKPDENQARLVEYHLPLPHVSSTYPLHEDYESNRNDSDGRSHHVSHLAHRADCLQSNATNRLRGATALYLPEGSQNNVTGQLHGPQHSASTTMEGHPCPLKEESNLLFPSKPQEVSGRVQEYSAATQLGVGIPNSAIIPSNGSHARSRNYRKADSMAEDQHNCASGYFYFYKLPEKSQPYGMGFPQDDILLDLYGEPPCPPDGRIGGGNRCLENTMELKCRSFLPWDQEIST